MPIDTAHPTGSARMMVIIGLVIMAVAAVAATAFIIAETPADPAGWVSAARIGGWIALIAGLCALAYFIPTWATPTLVVLTAAVIAIAVWGVAQPTPWRTFMDTNGPLLAVSALAVAIPTAVLAWRRTLTSGVMLMVLGLVPAGLLILARPANGVAPLSTIATSVGAVSLPIFLIGALFVVAAIVQRSDEEAQSHTIVLPPVVGTAGTKSSVSGGTTTDDSELVHDNATHQRGGAMPAEENRIEW